ncbi:unnamed protein product [Paramecium primaurelia]|uniref:E2 ubiquitin-conjugating enzyme n=1 Tax=Paramecium primaurelia TaxID=5886 RepID=A0A8S1LS90_PARPR|nr:unnamed protein product [Paramecium primaurelia]
MKNDIKQNLIYTQKLFCQRLSINNLNKFFFKSSKLQQKMIQEPQINPQLGPIIAKQLQMIIKQPIDGVHVILNEQDVFDIQADIDGPVDTPFQGGVFRCKLILPPQFPQMAPKGLFNTKIFHPNVSEKGEICVNTLKKDWNPNQWSLKNIFEVIKCLLIVPFPESSLNEEAGKLFMENYDEYFKRAKLLTNIYALKQDANILKGNNQIVIDEADKKNKVNQTQQKKENDQKKWLKRI